MDLLGSYPVFNLRDSEFRIYSRNEASPPQHLGVDAHVTNSIVTEGCEIDGEVENCVLSSGVHIERGAHVRDSVIMNDVVIGKGSNIEYSIVDSDTVIGSGSVVGEPKEGGGDVTVLGGGIHLEPNTVIPGGAMADEKYIETHIAHNVEK